MKHRRNIHCSVWKLLACWLNSKWRYHGNRGTKIMRWGDVRYCFAMAILVLITSPQMQSGDLLLFYVSFSLLLHHPDCCREMYCYSTFLFHYYYIIPTVVGWCIVILRFFFAIIKSAIQRLETYCFCSVSYYYYSLSFFLWTMNLSTADLRNYWIEFHKTWSSYRYMFLVGPKVFRFVVKEVKVIFLGVQRGWGLL